LARGKGRLEHGLIKRIWGKEKGLFHINRDQVKMAGCGKKTVLNREGGGKGGFLGCRRGETEKKTTADKKALNKDNLRGGKGSQC